MQELESLGGWRRKNIEWSSRRRIEELVGTNAGLIRRLRI